MDVFLIPAGPARYELYCEVGEEPAPPDEEPSRVEAARVTGRLQGVLARWRWRLVERFSAIVSGVEAARHGAAHRRATKAPRTFARRLRDRAVCWLAEAIAEQRLLWHLRGHQQVTAWFPDDVLERDASDRVRSILRADADRHFRWLLVDGVGLVLSVALVPIPGPNVILYYFIFRVVGHYLSRRGARHGLTQIEWQMRPSPALSDLRGAFTLEPEVRQRHVTEIASRLRLRHLAAFFERLAVAAP
jgi:hypothetical protein